jgi:primosomal protein N' (replication factor Y)
VTLTYHKKGNTLQCHLCGFIQSPPPSQCQNCSGDRIQLSGIGTQRVEDLVENTFPSAVIERLDTDSAKSAKTISETLAKFSNGEIDILLGTQMIAKGLDFENATLVGIINADTGLYLPDFRAGERVFQLIYQASGRAGRRKKQGEVVIQTYDKENPVIRAASKLDLKKYYNVLLNERKSLNYPPFSWIAKVEFAGKIKQNVEDVSQAVSVSLPAPFKGLDILGPSYCYRERIRDYWRMQIVFKSNKDKDVSGTKLHTFLKKGLKIDDLKKTQKGVRITIDINPVSLL